METLGIILAVYIIGFILTPKIGMHLNPYFIKVDDGWEVRKNDVAFIAIFCPLTLILMCYVMLKYWWIK